MSDMHDPYEDQLAAARYRAERDQARQELARLSGEATTVSAYDLLPEEERDAIAWVREHGGLDAVKRRWECLSYYADPVPRSCMEKRLARLQRQIDESHAALRRRREIISELNRRATDLTRENAKRGETIRKLSDRAAKQSDEIRVMRDVIAETCARLGVEGTGSTVDDAQVIWREISRRLMPEGMEWPRDESGEPVRPSDKLLDKDGDWFKAVSFVFTCDWWSVRGYQTEGFGDLNNETRRKLEGMAYGTCVKRPAPKVLDAEGTDIREKCDVWWICEGDERGVHAERLRVETICPNGLIECSPYNGGTWVYLEPSELYVNKPVPSSDGRPLSEGDHVYHVETGAELVVKKLPKPGEYQAVVVFALPTSPASHLTSFDPDQLTHERPDTWERIEEDAYKDDCEYFGRDLNGCEGCPASRQDIDNFYCDENEKASDLVRRAKALAGRDR